MAADTKNATFEYIMKKLRVDWLEVGEKYCRDHHLKIEGNAWDYLRRIKAIDTSRIDQFLLLAMKSHKKAKEDKSLMDRINVFYKDMNASKKREREKEPVVAVASTKQPRGFLDSDSEDEIEIIGRDEVVLDSSDIFEHMYEKDTPFVSVPISLINKWETMRFLLSKDVLYRVMDSYIPYLTKEEEGVIRSHGLFGIRKILKSKKRRNEEYIATCDIEGLAAMFHREGGPQFAIFLRSGYTKCINMPSSMEK